MHTPIRLPAGLSARAVARDDLAAVLAVICAYEERVLGESLTDLPDLESDFDRPSFEAERDSVLVLDGDEPVGWGEVFGGHRGMAVVVPTAWGRGIGTAIVDWSTAVAAAAGSERVGQTVPDADAAAAALLRSRGWEPLYASWVLELPPGSEVAPRPLPDGYALRDLRPGHDEQAAHRVIEEAFSEWPDREPVAYADWAAQVLGRPGFEPWQLLLVEHHGAVVGACYTVLSGETGWVYQLAVAREHRGRGLAQAVLVAAFAACRERGAPRAELSTDSRTGALPLYERLGMRVRLSFTHWTVAVGTPSG